MVCHYVVVNAWCLYIKFDARKNVCILKFRKKIIDVFLKIENKILPPKLIAQPIYTNKQFASYVLQSFINELNISIIIIVNFDYL